MAAKKNGLGKGLDSLIPSKPVEEKKGSEVQATLQDSKVIV